MLHYLMTALSVACLSLAVAAAGLHEPSADYIVRFSIEARWTEPGLKEQPTRTNNSPGNLGLQVETSKVFQCHFVPFLLGSEAGRTDEVFVTLILFAWLGHSIRSAAVGSGPVSQSDMDEFSDFRFRHQSVIAIMDEFSGF